MYSSYPSGPSTWTIVGGNYGAPQTPVPIIAYATCVQADFSLGLTIASSAVTDARSGTPANVIASCPVNSTVLGGGPQSTYRGPPSQFSDLPIAFSSYPNLDLSSWAAGVAPGNLGESVRAYAICARSHVSAANIVSGPLAVTGMDSTTVQCETGQLLTQGGYYSNASDDRFKPVYSRPEGPTPGTLGVSVFLGCSAFFVLYVFLSLFSWWCRRRAGMGGTRVSRRARRAVPRSAAPGRGRFLLPDGLYPGR